MSGGKTESPEGGLAFLALETQEDVLRYRHGFYARDALRLGNIIASLAAKEQRGVSVAIVRESDGMTLFQWSMDDKAPRNMMFIEGKRAAARLLGHCSLWAVAEEDYGESRALGDAELKAGDDGLCAVGASPIPSGGAIPLRTMDGSWEATLCISGLHEGRDHELGIRALCLDLDRMYGVDVPAYPGVPR